MRSSLSLFVFLSIALFAPAIRAQCRDTRGEPSPCEATVSVISSTEQTTLSGPVPVTPAPEEPPPSEPNQVGHTHRDTETAYADFSLLVEAVDTRQLHFSPMSPASVAEMVRGSVATGVGTPFETALVGFSLVIGARPLPWLRLPQLRLSAGFGDLEGASVEMLGGTQPLRATFHDLYYLRAEIGGGLDFDLDPIRLYALGHVAIAGYFAMATIDHAALGGLGNDTFAEDTWEAGWTVGMEIELAPEIAYTVGYRHIHTGVESNAVYLGLNVRLE